MSKMVAHHRPSVLIDATPLQAPSGLRGIGRYVYELLHGLAETRSVWEDRLELRALGELPPRGKPTITCDLAAAADEALAQRGKVRNSAMRLRRQLLLDPLARRAGAWLVHETEAIGTPIVTSVPRLVTCYDLIALRYPRHYSLRDPVSYAVRWITDWRRYASARRVVAISERTRKDICKLLRIDPNKIDTVTTGINLDRWMSPYVKEDDAVVLAEVGLVTPYVLYVGHGDYRKNVAMMFAALAEARLRTDIQLVWAGALRPQLLSALKRDASRAGVLNHVRFLGYVSDELLVALFRNAVAHLFVSRLEGFGLSVAESMAVGCPVIVARSSGTDEVAGPAGIVVDADDFRSAANALTMLALSPTERSARGALCRAQALKFKRSTMALSYIDSYVRALASSPPRTMPGARVPLTSSESAS